MVKELNADNLESVVFDLIDQMKVLFHEETWQNVLLNSTKNEMLVLLLLYREQDVNMTRIAEYLNVPLNTATGIVGRMEKKGVIERKRSLEDKRIVNIVLSEEGKEEVGSIIEMFMHYGRQILATLTGEEMALLNKVVERVTEVMKQDIHTGGAGEEKQRIRKIPIE
jgi:DNA-binding MarR family transcriptional regulator